MFNRQLQFLNLLYVDIIQKVKFNKISVTITQVICVNCRILDRKDAWMLVF